MIEGRMSLQEDLLAQIKRWDVDLGGELNADTPLIGSGLFDSLALVNLVAWIEQQLGARVDITDLDLEKEWDTVNDILQFIERQRNRGQGR